MTRSTPSRNVIDEMGHTHGWLTVREYAGLDNWRAATWLCACTCGRLTIQRGTRLRQGKVVSCGCQKRDHNVRQAARWQVSPKRRVQIAKLGGAARWQGGAE